MESVACFLRSLIVIFALFICIVVEIKALVWIARKLCAYVQYIQRVSEVFEANTAALKLVEPEVIPGIKDGITSENEESHLVKTTGQNKKNKKPFKEKEEIVAIEAADRGWVPICTSLLRMKRSGAEGRDSNIGNFRRRDMITPKVRPSLWPEDYSVKNKRGIWGYQERNSERIENRFCLASRPANNIFPNMWRASPIWNSTLRPWSLYQSSGKNQEGNTFSKVQGNSVVSKHVREESAPDDEIMIVHVRDDQFSKTEKSTAATIPAPCPVRLWSVDTDWKTTKEDESDVICAPGTGNSELNPGTENTKISPVATSNEINSRSNKMSLVLMVTRAVLGVVIDVAQPFCVYVDRKWDLFTDAVKHTDRELIASWLKILWSKACVFYQCAIKSAIRTVYGSIIIAFAAVMSEIAGITLRIYSVLVSPQPVASHELRSSCSGKDQKGPESREKQEINSRSQERSHSVACDRVSTTVKTTPVVRSAPFPVHLWSVDRNEERFKKQSSNSGDICSSRTMNNDINPKTSLQKGTFQHDSNTQRRKEQSKTLPNAVDHTPVSVTCNEGEVKLSSKRKVKKKVSFKVEEPVKTPLVEEKQGKAKPPTQVDLSARTTCETKKRVMPPLIPPSHVNAVIREKARVQVKSSPKVGISNLITPAKSRDESEVSDSHTSDKRSSVLEQDVFEDTGSRAKRRHIELELTYSDEQDSMSLTSQCGITAAAPSTALAGPTTRPRASMKRKAEDNQTAPANYEPTFLHSAVQTDQAAAQMPQRAGESLEDPDADEEMESAQEKVFSSNLFSFRLPSFLKAPFTSQPDDEMDIDPEQFSTWKVFSFALPSFLKAPFTSQQDDEMDIDPEQFSTWKVFSFVLPSFLTAPFTSQPTDEMDIDPEQFSTWKVFSLSLPSFLMPFTSEPPEEEVEMIELPLLVSPSNTEPKQMDTKQPAVDSTPSKQPVDVAGPAEAAGSGRLEAESPSLLTVQISHQLFDGCRHTASPSGEMTDTKRPLASIVGMLKKAAVPAKIPFAKQAMRQPAVKQPEIQRLVVEAATQHDNKPIFRPFAHLGALIHSQLNSAVEPCCNNSNSEGHPGIGEISTVENTSVNLASEEKEQDAAPKSISQFTMEQPQLEPPSDDPASYLADVSDSQSYDGSDEEYELDLETIEQFSELESSPEHAQLITKLLIEQESTQWHSVSDSDSDSDYGVKYELAELLDAETIEKHSALEDVLEISPEQAERIAKSLAEKETHDWHNVSGSDFEDESTDNIDLIEDLDGEAITQFPDLEDILENSPQDITFMVKLMEEKKSSGLHCNM